MLFSKFSKLFSLVDNLGTLAGSFLYTQSFQSSLGLFLIIIWRLLFKSPKRKITVPIVLVDGKAKLIALGNRFEGLLEIGKIINTYNG